LNIEKTPYRVFFIDSTKKAADPAFQGSLSAASRERLALVFIFMFILHIDVNDRSCPHSGCFY
ncbi:hypothetical protein ACFQ4J_09490, partial [Laceyella tengchongensis]